MKVVIDARPADGGGFSAKPATEASFFLRFSCEDVDEAHEVFWALSCGFQPTKMEHNTLAKGVEFTVIFERPEDHLMVKQMRLQLERKQREAQNDKER